MSEHTFAHMRATVEALGLGACTVRTVHVWSHRIGVQVQSEKPFPRWKLVSMDRPTTAAVERVFAKRPAITCRGLQRSRVDLRHIRSSDPSSEETVGA